MFPSDIDYDTKVTLETEMMPVAEELPFHILLLGDWSGREISSTETDLSNRRPIEIDRDNFDNILKKLDVKLNLSFQRDGENVLSLSFTELEDFHPDRIFQQLPLFANLRDVRRRLLNSNTFNDAAREVRSWYLEDGDDDIIANNPQPVLITASESETPQDDLLNQILFQSDENTSKRKSQNIESSELSAFVKKLVKPYLIQIDTTEQSNLLMIVDEVISDLMRKILHHSQFQALESAWRGAYFLIRRIETDASLKIYLLNVSKDELANNLKNVNNLENSLLFQIVAEEDTKMSSGNPWAVICGNYTFSLNVEDVATITRIAKIANASNTPFISHLKPELFGFKSFEADENFSNWKLSENSTENRLWTFLRTSPESTYLGLAMPRFLARLPYGERTEPTETFSFEEFTTSIEHEQYLWSNPVFINALLMAQTFREYSWDISQSFLQDVEGLPMHFYQDEHEEKTKPCAEVLMTQNNCEKILEQGLIPLISFKNTDKVRVGRFQSIAYPFTLLKGKWG